MPVAVPKSHSPGSSSMIGARLATKRHAKLREKRMALLESVERMKEEEQRDGEEGGVEAMKENESAPGAPPSTPKSSKNKQKSAVTDCTPASSTATTPNSSKKKKKGKNKEGNGQTEAAEMKSKSQPGSSSGNGDASAVNGRREEEEETGDDAWPSLKAFVPPVRTEEMSAERQRLKAARKLKKHPRAVVIERPPEPTVPKEATVPSAPTVSKPASPVAHLKKPTVPATPPTVAHTKKATLPSTPPTAAHSKEAIVPSAPTVSKPASTVAHPKKPSVPKESTISRLVPTVAHPKKPTVPSAPPTVGHPKKPTVPTTPPTVSKPAPTVSHPKKPTVPSTPPTGSHPMRDTVRQLGVRSPSRPSHIRFTSESPTNPAALPSPAKSFDNGREENSEGEETRRIGRMQRDSSPEVSTTSSESDDDDNGKEVDRKKKLTKRKEVTSSKMTPSKMTSIKLKLQEKSPKDTTMTSSEKKKDKKKSEEVKENIVTKPEKASSKEPRLRPSPDLLQMVAERLANGHGLLVFREICRETRRIAERQRRAADSVLHLEEFDDENAFTRDDMTAWWEERREVEDTMVREGKENRVHSQISEYLKERAVEKNLLRDMDGGVSHPSCAASAVDPLQLLQHPLETLDAACLLHGSQAGAAARLLQQEGRGMREVWLGHCSAKLVRELKYLKSIERFEHRKATMQTLENLPLLQITELRLDMIDDLVTRSALSDHLVNAQNLRALELNIAPTGPIDGNTSSHYSLFTKRSYDRGDYTEDLDWMIPNVEEGEPDPVTLCMPSLEHLATNVANAKLFWQLRDSTLLLRHLLSLRVGTLSKTKELIASSELFADTKESRRYKQPGFFALRDAYETVLESVTLRLADRVGMCRLQQETATIFEAIAELPPSLRRLSISLFYNQFSGVCAPFRKWAEPGVEAPDTDHIGIEEMHLHFERAFDLRGLPALLPRSIKTLSIALNYETDDDAKCLGPFLEMLPGFARLENLEDLHIQVWGVRCLEQLVAALSSSSILALRLTRLAVAAYPMDDRFFEPAVASSWLRSSLSAFPRVRTIGLHATVLTRLIPEERRSGYSWRNGVAWLANEMIGGCVGRKKEDKNGRNLDEVSLTASSALPMLDDGEEYTITPHWQVEFDATQLVLSPEDEEEREEVEDASYSIPHGADSDDSFLTDGEDEEDHAGEASRDDLELMEEGLEDETERIERRESRRDEKVRAAMERGEMVEHEEEEEGDVIDFDRISDQEDDEEHQPRSEFFDDEAVESDREESEEEENGKHEESADSDCSSEDDDKEREEERMKEEGRKQKRMERKQAKLENEVVRCKRKRAFDSDEEEEEIVIRVRAPSKKKRVVIDSDDE